MGSTIENLQYTVSQITNNQTDNGGCNNNGGNNNGGGKNNSGGNNNGGKHSQNINGGVNSRSNRVNFGYGARRHGAFSYMNTARVESTKVHDVHHAPNLTETDTIAHTE